MPISETYNEDCMIGLGRLPDKFFDLVIVDPPYFSGPERRGFYGKRNSSIGVSRVDYPVTEKWTVPGQEYFEELIRVSKHQIVWGCNYFDFPFGPGRIIWDKCNGSSSYSDCEIASCSMIDTVRQFRFMWNGMGQGKSISQGHIMQGNKKLNEKRIHPTQKPVALYKWLLSKYAKPGQKIGDTHLGSQSSRIAAWDYDVDFWGWEKEKEHFDRGGVGLRNTQWLYNLNFNHNETTFKNRNSPGLHWPSKRIPYRQYHCRHNAIAENHYHAAFPVVGLGCACRKTLLLRQRLN